MDDAMIPGSPTCFAALGTDLQVLIEMGWKCGLCQ